MNAVMLPARTVFICDTYVTPDPDAEHIAEMTLLAAEEVRRFGIGQGGAAVGVELRLGRHRRRRARCAARWRSSRERAPELEVEGEMHGDAALSEEIRLKRVSRTRG